MQEQKDVSLTKDEGFQRINEMLLAYWDQAKGDAPFPKERDINIEYLEPVWDCCFLIKFNDSELGYEYVYLGEALVAAYTDEQYEREACERLAFSVSSVDQSFQENLQHAKESMSVVELDGMFVNQQGLTVRYRSVLLPIGNDDDANIGFVLGGMRWKSYL